ncbi:universal stress protein [Acidothermaceae bacterium B102]|nr:universal stress protein [Acidothermaceae bacterium B102]
MNGFELGTDGPTVVLTGVDGTRTSMRAAAYAAGLARRQGALLVAVYVSGVGAAGGFAGLSAGSLAAVTMSSREYGEQLRAEGTAAAAQLGIRFRFITAEGDPYRELTRIADEVRAETVIIGASEAAGHRLVGSLAVRLVRAGKWPVTVVP